MLNISGIQEGFVLDHIQAGMSLKIYHDLKLDQIFILTDKENEVYRCKYCEEKFINPNKR